MEMEPITRQTTPQTAWQTALAEAYTHPEELVAAGLWDLESAQRAHGLDALYKMRIPREYADLFERDPARWHLCPIRRQALPTPDERDPELPAWARAWSKVAFGRELPWSADAIGDLAKSPAPRLTHRYENRAILHVSSACALYCRFCFRKDHLNDLERLLYTGSLDPAISYLEAHPEIKEVILTGGDPLALSDLGLSKLLERLRGMDHLKMIRIHSRMASTLPSRLTTELATLLATHDVALVSHFNHVRELTALARTGLERLKQKGVSLYNQSVLLRGVNDSPDTLMNLFQELYYLGVRPFYLHLADWTPGTFHFRTGIEPARRIYAELAGILPGPALPRLILDLPGGAGKIDATSARLELLAQQRSNSTDGRMLEGALYRATPPHTRHTPKSDAIYYADYYLMPESFIH